MKSMSHGFAASVFYSIGLLPTFRDPASEVKETEKSSLLRSLVYHV